MKKLIFPLLLFCALAFGQGTSPSTTGTISATGTTCATTNACIVLALQNTASVSTSSATITLSGSFTGTIQFEVTADNVNWTAIPGTPAGGGSTVTSATAAGVWGFSVPAYTGIRARASALAVPPVTVTIQSSVASAGVTPSTVCGDSGHALSWSGTAYGCQAITGSAAAGGNVNTVQFNNAAALGGITQWTTNGTTSLVEGATGSTTLGGTNTVPTGGTITTSGSGTIVATSSATAANLSGTPLLPNGTTAATQTPGDNTVKLATDAFVIANGGAAGNISGLGGMATGLSINGGTSGAVKAVTPYHTENFTVGTSNICQRIKAAIAASLLANASTSVLIDASGENQYNICPANDATQMFDGLRAASSIGGKIILPCGGGIYADGPGVAGHFADSFNSVVGTAAFMLPALTTIQGGCGARANIGASRSPNSVLGVCDGSGIPIAGCTARFPVRFNTISSEAFVNATANAGSSSSTTTCTPNNATFSPRYCTMYITVSDGPFVLGGNNADPAGANLVYVQNTTANGSGEAVAIANCVSCTAAQGNGTQLNQATPADNAGMYEVSVLCTGAATGDPPKRGAAGQVHGEDLGCSTTSQIGIRVKAGTAVCSTHCGNLLFGTPVVGVAPPGAQSFTAQLDNPGNLTQGAKLIGVGIDMANTLTGYGILCAFCQEHTEFWDVNLSNISYGGFVTMSSNNQNWGPYRVGEIYLNARPGQTHNWQCGPHSFAIFNKSADNIRGFDSLTITADVSDCDCSNNGVTSCNSSANVYANAAKAAVYADSGNWTISNWHCEGFVWCAEVGDSENVSNFTIQNITGQPNGNTAQGLGVVHIDPRNQPYDVILNAIGQNFDPYTIYDEFNLGNTTAYPIGPLSITSVGLAGGNCTYNFASTPPAANNGLKGITVNNTAFAQTTNNGLFTIDSSTATTAVVNSCGGAVDTTGTMTTVTGLLIKDPRVDTYVYDMDASGAQGSRVCTSPNCPNQFNYGISKLTTTLPCYSGVSPAVCKTASSGWVAIPAGTNPTLQINTSAISANSGIELTITDEASIGTLLGVTCNSTIAQLFQPFVTARTAGTSLTIGQSGTTAANPVCVHYLLLN